MTLPEETRLFLRRGLERLFDERVKFLLFGSFAKGQGRAASDIDIAIIGATALDLATLAQAKEFFDESQLEHPVDLVDFARVSESFQSVIKSESVEL